MLLFSVCQRPPQTPSGARPGGTDATITFLPFRLMNKTVLWWTTKAGNQRAAPAAPRFQDKLRSDIRRPAKHLLAPAVYLRH